MLPSCVRPIFEDCFYETAVPIDVSKLVLMANGTRQVSLEAAHRLSRKFTDECAESDKITQLNIATMNVKDNFFFNYSIQFYK